MFDTVNFWIDSSNYEESEILEKFHENSKDIKEIYSIRDDRHTYYGSIKNYKVGIHPSGITLRGSIAKYFFGEDTIKFANRLSYRKSIEEIFCLLNLDLNNATVTRVDVGQNFKLSNCVLHYYPLLLTASYLKREVLKNSLYFKNNRKQLVFYDKILERREKRYNLSGNLLRYELRLMKNPNHFLNTQKLYAKDLCKKKIYKQLVKLWYMEYKKIRKNSNCDTHLNFNNAKDLKNNLAASALSKLDLVILKDIELKQKNGLIDNVTAHRCRNLIIELQSNKDVETKSNDLLKELNSKIKLKYNQCLKLL